jgi:hypothetical protein
VASTTRGRNEKNLKGKVNLGDLDVDEKHEETERALGSSASRHGAVARSCERANEASDFTQT